MVRVACIFCQLLHHFSRSEFAALVRKHGAEKHSKGLTCWTQFFAMLFCQSARADSLREICNGLAYCLGKLAHLGIGTPPLQPGGKQLDLPMGRVGQPSLSRRG